MSLVASFHDEQRQGKGQRRNAQRRIFDRYAGGKVGKIMLKRPYGDTGDADVRKPCGNMRFHSCQGNPLSVLPAGEVEAIASKSQANGKKDDPRDSHAVPLLRLPAGMSVLPAGEELIHGQGRPARGSRIASCPAAAPFRQWRPARRASC